MVLRWVVVLLVLSPCGAGETASWRGDGSGDFSAGLRLVENAAQARVLWISEERAIPPGWIPTTGKVESGVVGGYGGPVPAGDAVYLCWYEPAGDVIDEVARGREPDKNPDKWKVAARDVILAMDAADGTTRWKVVLDGGLNHNWRRQGPLAHPVVVGDRLLVGNRLLRAADLADLGQLPVPWEPHTTPAYAGGMAFVRGPVDPGRQGASGCIRCIDLRWAP